MMSPPTHDRYFVDSHDRYFVELAEILRRDGPPNSEAIAALRAKYDAQQLSSLTTGAELSECGSRVLGNSL
ncbi:MAG: hypothetical protein M3018_12175 [Actinomycetota bacterium]|nr:hypothetical protein [Actinomycetota bacterium]